jgi:GxxExxY protein
MGLACKNHPCIKVFYDAVQVGEYFADIIVEDCIIIENKTAESLIEENELQLVNYLRATEIEIGLLLNIGKSLNLKERFLLITEKKSAES